MSNKTVPTVYQSSKTAKNSQKTVKTAKMRRWRLRGLRIGVKGLSG